MKTRYAPKSKALLWLLAFAVVFPIIGHGAPVTLNLLSPLDFQVFQRQSQTEGKIVIDCVLTTSDRGLLTNVEGLQARLIGKSAAGKLPGLWQPLPFNARARRFRAEETTPAGGWYRLEVRLIGADETKSVLVEHVGVGEVFLIAGQSNAANHGEGRQKPDSPLVAAFGHGRWQPANDPQPTASGTNGSFLPAFGDAMVLRLKVPVGLVPLAEGSTSAREWLPKGDGMAAPPSTGRNVVYTGSNGWVSAGALFSRITAAQDQLGPNGFRALLWHQGESDSHQSADCEITPAQYRQYLQRIIAASRAAAGWRAPWFVAQVSYHSPIDPGTPELRAAQKSLVTDGIVLAGPDTDNLGPEFREQNGNGTHFNPRGLRRHGELWAGCVISWLEQSGY